ncbi:helix-turn-helix transcriptional regulator [Spirillospora sp. NPDC052269]
MTELDPNSSSWDYFITHMKRVRGELGISGEALGKRINCTKGQISNVENKARRPTLRLAGALDGLPNVPPDMFTPLIPRIEEEIGFPPGFLDYLEEEARASQLRMYFQYMVPGIFQTVDYARAVLGAANRANRIDELLATRMERQEILVRDEPPSVVALLEEHVVRKIVGSREIARGQLARLLELCREPHVTIQIVPDDAAVYPESSATLLSFIDGPDSAYQEGLGGRGALIEAGREVARMATLFEQIRAVALAPPDSAALIREVWEAR